MFVIKHFIIIRYHSFQLLSNIKCHIVYVVVNKHVTCNFILPSLDNIRAMMIVYEDRRLSDLLHAPSCTLYPVTCALV